MIRRRPPHLGQKSARDLPTPPSRTEILDLGWQISVVGRFFDPQLWGHHQLDFWNTRKRLGKDG